MATTKIIVPDFNFSGFYYAEILRRVRIFNRVNVPEITAEVAEEPFIQLERAFALVGHYNNVLLDLAANELLVPTLKLQDSARLLLQLIDFQIRDYAPAAVELLAELTQTLTTSVALVEANSTFETARVEDEDAVPFEVVDAVTAGPTDVLDGVFGEETVRAGSDGTTVFGDPDAFESATLAAAGADVNSIVQIGKSVLGNNGIFKIVEVMTSGSPGKFRLAAALGGENPLFIFEAGLSWTIRTFTANGATAVATAGAPFFAPWAAGPVAGDKLYLASRYVMLEELALAFQTGGSSFTGVWEYHDPDLSDDTPDSVVNMGSYLRFGVDALLDPESGVIDRHGALVKVTHLPSGTFELVESTWAGPGNYVDVSAFLGQSGTPSTTPGDYAVGSDWNPVPGVSDGTLDLSTDADLTFDLPQTLRKNWQKLEVEGVEGYYLRYRVIDVTGPTAPVIDTVDPSGSTQYLLLDATQGEAVTNEPTVSSSGQAGQSFVLATTPGLRDTVRTFVDEGGGEVEWTNRTATNDSLLTSGPKDRHFVVAQDALGELVATFGDGTRGKIPPLGVDNVRFEYRVNATDDGNVGADTITVDATGAALVASVTNPRAAFGWREADGASEESLALVKEEGPASLRTLGRAVNPWDYEDLAVAFVAANGTRPVVRAKAIEEGFGVKTIKLVVVGVNGVSISGTIKDELETYFNGDDAQGVKGVGQSNTEVTVVNFVPLSIGPTLVIEANSALTETLVKTTLATLISPTAKASNGSSWVWRFGGRVPLSRIEAEVFQISPGNVFDVDVTVPTADLELTEDGLPLLDSTALSISIVAPAIA
jgi:hypothetical protein